MATSGACAIHPGQSADSTCTKCGASVCSACVMFNREGHCQACARTGQRRSGVSRVVIAATFAGVIGVGMWGLLNAPGRGTSALSKAEAERERAYVAYAEILVKAPCDRAAIVGLAKAMYAAEDLRRGADRADAFFRKCGEDEPLRWMALAFHKRLGESRAALADADKLVAAQPSNKDYRSARASLYEQTGQLEKAAEEYGVAIATSPDVVGIPTNVANVYEKLGRPCEAVAPLEQLVYPHPDATPGPRSRLKALYANPSCATALGSGRGVVRIPPGAGDAVATVRVNGTANGKLVVDRAASLTVLAPKFATALGLPYATWPRIAYATAAGARSGRLGGLDEVDADGARAPRIVAVVADEEGAAGLDGVVGESFLARFDVRVDATQGSMTLTARGRTADGGGSP